MRHEQVAYETHDARGAYGVSGPPGVLEIRGDMPQGLHGTHVPHLGAGSTHVAHPEHDPRADHSLTATQGSHGTRDARHNHGDREAHSSHSAYPHAFGAHDSPPIASRPHHPAGTHGSHSTRDPHVVHSSHDSPPTASQTHHSTGTHGSHSTRDPHAARAAHDSPPGGSRAHHSTGAHGVRDLTHSVLGARDLPSVTASTTGDHYAHPTPGHAHDIHGAGDAHSRGAYPHTSGARDLPSAHGSNPKTVHAAQRATDLYSNGLEVLRDHTSVCILGGTKPHVASESLVTALAQALEQTLGHQVLFVTAGMPGVQEVFAKHFRDASRLVNILPQSSRGHEHGHNVHVGASPEECRDIVTRVGHVYVTIEGDEHVARDAEAAASRGAAIVPLIRSGGASSGMHGFPVSALERPLFIGENHWALLSNHSCDVQVSAAAASTVVAAHVAVHEAAGAHVQDGSVAAMERRAEELEKRVRGLEGAEGHGNKTHAEAIAKKMDEKVNALEAHIAKLEKQQHAEGHHGVGHKSPGDTHSSRETHSGQAGDRLSKVREARADLESRAERVHKFLEHGEHAAPHASTHAAASSRGTVEKVEQQEQKAKALEQRLAKAEAALAAAQSSHHSNRNAGHEHVDAHTHHALQEKYKNLQHRADAKEAEMQQHVQHLTRLQLAHDQAMEDRNKFEADLRTHHHKEQTYLQQIQNLQSQGHDVQALHQELQAVKQERDELHVRHGHSKDGNREVEQELAILRQERKQLEAMIEAASQEKEAAIEFEKQVQLEARTVILEERDQAARQLAQEEARTQELRARVEELETLWSNAGINGIREQPPSPQPHSQHHLPGNVEETLPIGHHPQPSSGMETTAYAEPYVHPVTQPPNVGQELQIQRGSSVVYLGGGRFTGNQQLGNFTLHVGDQGIVDTIPGKHGELGCKFGPLKVSLDVADVQIVQPAVQAPVRTAPTSAVPMSYRSRVSESRPVGGSVLGQPRSPAPLSTRVRGAANLSSVSRGIPSNSLARSSRGRAPSP